MPTDKPRVTITISEETLQQIEGYWHDNRMKNQTQAILSLLEVGLADFEQKKNPCPDTDKDMRLDKINQLYQDLNEEGQEKLADYADDLVSSGKYKKYDSSELGRKKA